MKAILKKLTDKGAAMRKAQKAYFASGKMSDQHRWELRDKAKAIEREFDQAIVEAEKALSTQTNLFP